MDMRTLVSIGCSLALAGCAKPAPAPVAPGVAGTVAVELDGVVAACSAALDRPDALAAGRTATVAACADLFAQPACREAWIRADRIGLIEPDLGAAAACRDAYCGTLDGAEAACAPGPIDMTGWARLEAQILAHDLGASRAAAMTSHAVSRARALAQATLTITPQPKAPSLQQLAGCDDGAIVTIAITAGFATIDAGAAAPRTLARCGSALDDAALRAELRALRAGGCSEASPVTIAASPAVRYGDVVAAMDAAAAAGFRDIAIDTSGPAAPRVAPVAAPSACAATPASPSAPASPLRPPSPAAGSVPQVPPIVTVTTAAVWLDDRSLASVASVPATGTIPALTAALAGRPGGAGDGTLVLQADQAVSAGVIARVIETARGASFTNVLFAIQSRR